MPGQLSYLRHASEIVWKRMKSYIRSRYVINPSMEWIRPADVVPILSATDWCGWCSPGEWRHRSDNLRGVKRVSRWKYNSSTLVPKLMYAVWCDVRLELSRYKIKPGYKPDWILAIEYVNPSSGLLLKMSWYLIVLWTRPELNNFLTQTLWKINQTFHTRRCIRISFNFW